jgi:hypothetical protein
VPDVPERQAIEPSLFPIHNPNGIPAVQEIPRGEVAVHETGGNGHIAPRLDSGPDNLDAATPIVPIDENLGERVAESTGTAPEAEDRRRCINEPHPDPPRTEQGPSEHRRDYQ